MTDLSGRKSLATEARGALGAAIARRFAVRNAHLAVSGRNEGDCATEADAIERSGGRTFGIRCFALSSGMTGTSMQAAIRAPGINRISGVPRDRLPRPAAPAEIAAWLVSGAAHAFATAIVSTRDQAVKKGMGWAELMTALDDTPRRNRAFACRPQRGARQAGSFRGLRREAAGAGN